MLQAAARADRGSRTLIVQSEANAGRLTEARAYQRNQTKGEGESAKRLGAHQVVGSPTNGTRAKVAAVGARNEWPQWTPRAALAPPRQVRL